VRRYRSVLAMTLTLPIRLVSTANLREHWAVKAKRTKGQRTTTAMVLRSKLRGLTLPVDICITRIAPRMLDTDNCVASMKAVQDGIADAFKLDDRSPLLRFEYAQRKGKPREYGVEISIVERAKVAS
jgi:hypothetical protein